MLTKFPDFSLINMGHKEAVEVITKKFEPYSDFDFTSLFCWNTDGSTEIATLNDNLVIKIPDYTSGEPLYSLLGESHIDESLEELIKVAGKLELIPEPVVMGIRNKSAFSAIEDPDQFDYVYSLEDHAYFKGGKFKGKRNKMGRFMKQFGPGISMHQIDFQNSTELKRLKDVFFQWADEKKKTRDEIQQESTMIDRLIKSADNFNLMGLELSVDDKSIGFSVVEKSHHDYAVYHFQKTLTNSVGVDIYLTNQTSKLLLDSGSKYINWEQDLGIEGLRQTKINYKPIKMLKKYKVQGTLL